MKDVALIQPSHKRSRKRKCSGDPAHIRLDLGRPTSAAQLQQWVSESFSRGGGMARLGGCRPPRDSQCLFVFGGFTLGCIDVQMQHIQNFGFADVCFKERQKDKFWHPLLLLSVLVLSISIESVKSILSWWWWDNTARVFSRMISILL